MLCHVRRRQWYNPVREITTALTGLYHGRRRTLQKVVYSSCYRLPTTAVMLQYHPRRIPDILTAPACLNHRRAWQKTWIMKLEYILSANGHRNSTQSSHTARRNSSAIYGRHMSEERVRDLFFTQDSATSHFSIWKCGKVRKVSESGYTILVNVSRAVIGVLHGNVFKYKCY